MATFAMSPSTRLSLFGRSAIKSVTRGFYPRARFYSLSHWELGEGWGEGLRAGSSFRLKSSLAKHNDRHKNLLTLRPHPQPFSLYRPETWVTGVRRHRLHFLGPHQLSSATLICPMR